MQAFKKGPRKGSYNPVGPKKGPTPRGFKHGLKRDASRPLEMHQATCVSCKKFCEVPFKPNGKKPVFCRDCFSKQDPEPARAHAKHQAYPERTVVHTSIAPRQDDLRSQIEALTAKVDTLTRMVGALSSKAGN
jgi:CxxC-x17-CxxC domain-containing protein